MSQPTNTLLEMENGVFPHLIGAFEDNLTTPQDVFELGVSRTAIKTLTIVFQQVVVHGRATLNVFECGCQCQGLCGAFAINWKAYESKRTHSEHPSRCCERRSPGSNDKWHG